jgi:hypothetical protein
MGMSIGLSVVALAAIGWGALTWRRRTARWLMSAEWLAAHTFEEEPS